MDIYGQYKDSLEAVMRMMAASMERYAKAHKDDSGELIYEHLRYRLKSEKSMQAKLEARGLPLTPCSALCEVRDAIGFRVVCRFIDDIYKNISRIKDLPGITVVKEKDYILDVKSNGYRSYHMIIEIPVFFSDRKEKMRVEVQIRTMAMDFWASLDHQMKYKKDLDDSGEISEELKECAEIIAQTDLKMQSIRQKIENRADPSRLLQFDKD